MFRHLCLCWIQIFLGSASLFSQTYECELYSYPHVIEEMNGISAGIFMRNDTVVYYLTYGGGDSSKTRLLEISQSGCELKQGPTFIGKTESVYFDHTSQEYIGIGESFDTDSNVVLHLTSEEGINQSLNTGALRQSISHVRVCEYGFLIPIQFLEDSLTTHYFVVGNSDSVSLHGPYINRHFYFYTQVTENEIGAFFGPEEAEDWYGNQFFSYSPRQGKVKSLEILLRTAGGARVLVSDFEALRTYNDTLFFVGRYMVEGSPFTQRFGLLGFTGGEGEYFAFHEQSWQWPAQDSSLFPEVWGGISAMYLDRNWMMGYGVRNWGQGEISYSIFGSEPLGDLEGSFEMTDFDLQEGKGRSGYGQYLNGGTRVFSPDRAVFYGGWVNADDPEDQRNGGFAHWYNPQSVGIDSYQWNKNVNDLRWNHKEPFVAIGNGQKQLLRSNGKVVDEGKRLKVKLDPGVYFLKSEKEIQRILVY